MAEECNSVALSDYICIDASTGFPDHVNCVKCDAHLRCTCPHMHYLDFIEEGACPQVDYQRQEFVKNWDYEPPKKYCDQWSECGYICRHCPAGKYNYHDNKCEGENGLPHSCCVGRDESDPRFLEHRASIDAFDAEAARVESERQKAQAATESFDDGVKTLQDGFGEIESDLGVWEPWELDVTEMTRRGEHVYNHWLEDGQFPSFMVGACGSSKTEARFCSEGSALRDMLFTSGSCVFSSQSGMMTISYMPHDLDHVYGYNAHYRIVENVRPMVCRQCFDSSEQFIDGEPVFFSTLCHGHDIRKYQQRCYCDNCVTIDKQTQYLNDNMKTLTLDQSRNETQLTYNTECLPFIDGKESKHAKVSGWFGELVATVTTPIIPLEFEDGELQIGDHNTNLYSAISGTTKESRVEFLELQEAREMRCEYFKTVLNTNGQLEPKTVKCWQDWFDDYIDESYGCVKVDVQKYSLASDSSIAIATKQCSKYESISDGIQPAKLQQSGSAAQSVGILNSCVVNRGSLSMNLCEARDVCFKIDEVFEEMRSRPGGLKIDPLHDYLNLRFLNDASARKAMNVFLPALPDGSVMYTYRNDNCEGRFYGYRSLSTIDGHPKTQRLRFDVEAVDSAGRTVEQRVMDEWEELRKTGRFDTQYACGDNMCTSGWHDQKGRSIPPYTALQEIVTADFMNNFDRLQGSSLVQSFKIVLSHEWQCECSDGLVFDDAMTSAEQAIFDTTGLHKCKSCEHTTTTTTYGEETQRRSIIVDSEGLGPLPCGKRKRECQVCPYGSFPNEDSSECIRCGQFEVASYDSSTHLWECISCTLTEYFFWQAGMEFGECKLIPVMDIVKNVEEDRIDIIHFGDWDQYVPSRQYPNEKRRVPQNHYLDLSVQEAPVVRACLASQIPNTFRQDCGLSSQILIFDAHDSTYHRISEADNTVLYDISTETYYINHAFASVSNFHNLQILRGGYIQHCTTCLSGQYLSSPCQSDYPGSPGTCSACKTCADTPDNCAATWLYHETEQGCETRVSNNMAQAVTDYEVRQCQRVEVVGGEIFLAIGCGTQFVSVWDFRATCINGGAHSCGDWQWNALFGDGSQTDGADGGTQEGTDNVATGGTGGVVTRANVQLGGAGISIRMPWRNPNEGVWEDVWVNFPPHDAHREYSDLIPFCPPGHYVGGIPTDIDRSNAATFEKELNNLFGSVTTWGHMKGWCRICRTECIHETAAIPLHKSANYRRCSGSTEEDTQDRCQEGCDLNFYYDSVAEKCRQCEMCDVDPVAADAFSEIHITKDVCTADRVYDSSRDLCVSRQL